MLYDPKWEVPVDIKLEPWQQILLKAADILERDGWCQGRLHEQGTGHRCAVGAMLKAGMTNIGLMIGYEAAYQKISSTVGYRCVEQWNDRDGRTKEKVISTMREIAAS